MKTYLKYTPIIIVLILISFVIAIPNILEFDFNISPTNPTVVPTGQYLVHEGWVFLYGLVVLLVVLYISFLIDLKNNYVFFVFNISILETLKGNYYYKIDEVENKVRIYKLDYTNYEELKYYNFTLHKGITISDITHSLDSIARQLDESNYSYIKEELSTWKRFK